MKHLIVCPEYPPAEYAGGIGTYVHQISRMLVEAGDTVHVVAVRWKGARVKKECPHDRLTIHRVGEIHAWWHTPAEPGIRARELRGLRESSFPPQAFSFQAALLVEKLIEHEEIDIVEGQEFEAPLYYLQLRRALGLGPARKPPCIIHLHSPMEFIVRHNDWEIHHPYFRTAKRLEDYSIQTADAWLCPSRYLARHSESHYGLPNDSIRVISLPINAAPFIERPKETWKKGTILYVGRMERRKGIMEWILAAVRAARKDARLNFEFIGANCLGTDDLNGDAIIADLVPTDLKHQFHFHGEQKRSHLPRFLSEARLAVVPSRWENFPNTCVEAMCTGLPVIATKEGGMAEMIDQGRTGWLAESADTDGLYEALEQALQTSAANLAEMSMAASASIRKKCDNNRILKDHLAFRHRILERGAIRSKKLVTGQQTDGRELHQNTSVRNRRHNPASKGIALVVTCHNTGDDLNECLDSISCQTRQPVAVVVVDENRSAPGAKQVPGSKKKRGWEILSKPHGDNISGKNLGIQHLLKADINPAGFSFLNAEDALVPHFVETCSEILDHCPDVGLISGWVDFTGNRHDIWIRPCPGFPYQWVFNEVAPFAAVRTGALMAADRFRSGMEGAFEYWDLFNSVLASNWTGVTVPGILGYCRIRKKVYSGSKLNVHRRMRKAMLARFPDLMASDAEDIIMMAEAHTGWLLQQQYFMVQSRLSRAFGRISSRLHPSRAKKRRLNGMNG